MTMLRWTVYHCPSQYGAPRHFETYLRAWLYSLWRDLKLGGFGGVMLGTYICPVEKQHPPPGTKLHDNVVAGPPGWAMDMDK